MKNKIFIAILCVSVLTISCGKKKSEKKPPVKREVKTQPLVVKDTLPPVPEPEPEPEIIEKPQNKYFLIAGCFEVEENAYNFRDALVQQGYDAEIVNIPDGVYSTFYKVSYKGFSDRTEAFEQLAIERSQPDKENIWLLIKE
jgi:cell division protein FtsN